VSATYEEWVSGFALTARGGIAFTKANQLALVTWCAFEGNGGRCNPFNDTRVMPGSWPLRGNSAGVQNYISLREGLDAIWSTLQIPGYGYPAILAALKDGGCACAVTMAVARSQWGTWRANPAAALRAVEQVNADYPAYARRLVYGS
jgi:hypothetical protein